MKKKSLLIAIVAMLFATGLTFGQHQSRPLPIYRYFVDGAPDNLNVMDNSVSSLAADTTTLPYPAGPALTYGGWDTGHIVGPYNWVVDHYTVGGYNELKGSGYKSGNIATDQWYISPYFSTKQYHGVTLQFASSCGKYPGPAPLVMVSTSFRNEVINPAQWDTLKNSGIVYTVGISAAISLHPSAAINLDAYQGDSVCIAFRYLSNPGGAANVYIDSISITGTAGINEISAADAKVTVYPNPVRSTVTISDASGMIKDVEIYNLVGELVYAIENVDNNKCIISTENLQQGMYFTKVILKNGTFVSNKIVKE